MKKTAIIQLISIVILFVFCFSAWANDQPVIVEGKFVEFKNHALTIREKNGENKTVQINDKTFLRSFDHKPVRLDKLAKYTRLYVVVPANGIATNVTVLEVSE